MVRESGRSRQKYTIAESVPSGSEQQEDSAEGNNMSDTSRMSTFVAALTPLVIGIMGTWFNRVYQEEQAHANAIAAQRLALEQQQKFLIDKATVVKEYFGYIANKADSNQQRAALAVLASLGYTDLVIKLVTSDPTPENVQTLAAIATSSNSDASNSALGALESLQSSQVPEVSGAVERALTGAQSREVGVEQKAVVVIGANRTLDAALGEVKQAEAAGLKAEVVRRGDWFRTVVPVESSATQQQTLETAKAKVRGGAYVVDYAKWCSSTDQSKCAKAE
jgi:hypothetical protein